MKFFKAVQKSDTDVKPSKRVKKFGKDPKKPGLLEGKVPNLLSDELATIGKPSADGTPISKTDGVTSNGIGHGSRASHALRQVREISVEPQSVNPCLVAITKPNSAFAEEYRNLRTTLLQKAKKQRLHTIVVASVAPGEGKSVTALNLAWLLAQSEGVSALVIDGDLRRPSLNKYLGFNAKVGLSDVLDGELELSDAVVKLNPAGLYLLPGGRVRTDVAELLSGPSFARIFSDAVDLFRYVIIDGPPLGTFTDAKIVINNTDGALLVIRRNFTHYQILGRVMENLPAEKLLGVVLNDSEEPLIETSYYDYSY
jgi:capsular exopolysaccharide synthesis family protein